MTQQSSHQQTSVFTPEQHSAVARCLELNLPFVLYMRPGDSSATFMASEPEDGNNRYDLIELKKSSKELFVIHEGLVIAPTVLVIRAQYNEKEVNALPTDKKPFAPSEAMISPEETSFAVYYARVKSLTRLMPKSVRKIVLSRVICTPYTGTPSEIAETYFRDTQNCMRALFFTQETGLWIVATPELLLKYDDSARIFQSMSLAGTRRAGEEADKAWSRKNTEEHNYVSQYIEEVYGSCGLEAKRVESPDTLTSGAVEHIMDMYSATGQCNSTFLLNMLNPTPAVAGYPKDKALDLIARSESHSRGCYSGWIGFFKNNDLETYVTLRCANLYPANGKDPGKAVIFAGGGLVAGSEPYDEWIEGALKVKPLYEAIESHNEKPLGHGTAYLTDSER
ncbi:MAG: chorismate-binding protein [Paramuribaculum sp.]|nr:chorismate-binding protein [Paramuribaculum sp.]